MELHRALWLGRGFYTWMTGLSADSPTTLRPDDEQSPRSHRKLPIVNFLDIGDDALANVFAGQASLQDRDRFRGYLSRRPLGLGIIMGVGLPRHCLRFQNAR